MSGDDRAADPVWTLRNVGVLATCLYGLGTGCLVLANYVIGAFVYPLSQAFGWSRRDILLAYSVMTIVTMGTSFLGGWLSDRFPPRRVVIPSQIAFGLSFVLLAVLATGDLARFYLLHLVMAIVAAGCLPVAFNVIVAATFVRNRGIAFGIMLTGSGLCGVLVPPYLTFLIGHFGWRIAYAGLAVIPIGGALLLSFPLLPKVRQIPAAATLGQQALIGVKLREAVRDRRLWTIGVSLFLGSALSTGIVSNFVPLLRDQGIGPLVAAGALSTFGLAVIGGRLLVGALVDRFWAPPIALMVMIPAAMALLILADVPVSTPVAYGCAICLGIAAGAEGDMLSYLGAQYFGLAHAGRIYAFVFVFFTAGIGVGGPLFGWTYDHFGTYRLALYVAAFAWVLCGSLLLTLGPYPKFEASAETIS